MTPPPNASKFMSDTLRHGITQMPSFTIPLIMVVYVQEIFSRQISGGQSKANPFSDGDSETKA